MTSNNMSRCSPVTAETGTTSLSSPRSLWRAMSWRATWSRLTLSIFVSINNSGGFGGDFAHVVEDPSVAGADFFVRGDGDGDEIHVGVGVFDYFVESFPQEGAGPVQAGRVHHDDLGVVAVDDAADGVPGGFRLVGGDGDFLPHQGVCQC